MRVSIMFLWCMLRALLLDYSRFQDLAVICFYFLVFGFYFVTEIIWQKVYCWKLLHWYVTLNCESWKHNVDLKFDCNCITVFKLEFMNERKRADLALPCSGVALVFFGKLFTKCSCVLYKCIVIMNLKVLLLFAW